MDVLIINSYLLASVSTLLWLGMSLVYFRLARHFQIVDQPNHRSSHTAITIRGGGITFPLSLFLYYPFSTLPPSAIWFGVGLLFIALISFWDDLRAISNTVRLCIHLLAVSLLLYSVGYTTYPPWLLLLVGILMIGIINVYNFMDGINGLTGLYSLVCLGSLSWLNTLYQFVDPHLLLVLGSAILVFLFFNFRKKAVCFSGDVGSISMAFILCFLLLLLIQARHQLIYLGLLLVYGLDASTTIFFRLIRKENIFEAHRSHFYQFLVNQKRYSALWVSAAYAVTQLLINVFLISNYEQLEQYKVIVLITITGLLVTGFGLLRILVEGRSLLSPQK